MRMFAFRYFLLAAPLLLAGCGDGWEVQRVTNYVPYTQDRTAGSGVAYVRAKMLPEKEIVVEQKAVAPAEPAGEIKSGDKIFAEAQTKGSKVGATPVVSKTATEKPKETKTEKKEDVKESEQKAQVSPAAGAESTIRQKTTPAAQTYEQRLDSQLNKSPDKVEPRAGSATPEKQSSLIGVPGSGADMVDVPEESSESASSGVMPVKELRSPKMDVYNREYEAEKSLEEIYSNPF